MKSSMASVRSRRFFVGISSIGRPRSLVTDADTFITRCSRSTSRSHRRPHNSPRRTPVVAATRIALAISGRLPRSASAINARTSSGVGTVGSLLGIEGGSAHCAGFDSRQPHRQACVNIDERQAWIWYTVRGASPGPDGRRRGRSAS